MLTLRRAPALQTPTRSQKAPRRDQVPAERVREMLREIAFVLHATRVVRRMDEGAAASSAPRPAAPTS